MPKVSWKRSPVDTTTRHVGNESSCFPQLSLLPDIVKRTIPKKNEAIEPAMTQNYIKQLPPNCYKQQFWWSWEADQMSQNMLFHNSDWMRIESHHCSLWLSSMANVI